MRISNMAITVCVTDDGDVPRAIGWMWPDSHDQGWWSAHVLSRDYAWSPLHTVQSRDDALGAIMEHARREWGYEVPR